MRTRKGPPTMEMIVEKLDTVCEKVDTLQTTVTEIKENQIAADLHLAGLIDPPNVEKRLMDYVDKRDEHKQNNSAQALIQVQHILQLEAQNAQLKLEAQIKDVALAQSQTELNRKQDHQEQLDWQSRSDKRTQRLERAYWMGAGMIALLGVVLKLLK